MAKSAEPRITYWTGWLSPEMEGCSKEVFALKSHFRRSRVIGLSQHYVIKASLRDRYFGLNVRGYPLLRAAAPALEWSADLHHIYGGLREWFFLRMLRRKPIVMTVVTTDVPLEPALYRHVRRFVVHSPRTTETLVQHGVAPELIRTIYPGMDLARFKPRRRSDPPLGSWPYPASGFRVLFATTPNWEGGLEARGVNLLLQAARRLPDVDFFLPWRPWVGADRLVARCREQAPSNVHISLGPVHDMRALFAAADATVAPFTQVEGNKLAPTSLLESLAAGRPLLVSDRVGIADLIRAEECGEVFVPSVDGLCDAIARLRGHWKTAADNARACAERHFDLRTCLKQHESLYGEVMHKVSK